MAPEAAANPKVGKTFLAKNGNTSFPKLSKLLKKPPCFCNCVLLKFICIPCPDAFDLLILFICRLVSCKLTLPLVYKLAFVSLTLTLVLLLYAFAIFFF